MKKRKLYLILTTAFLIAACSPAYYVPNTVNTPLFNEKDELHLTLTAGASEHATNFGLNTAFSITNNTGVMVNLASFEGSGEIGENSPIEPSEDYNPTRSGQMAEVGIGFFKPFESNSNFIFETYAGYGLYSGNVAINNQQSVSFAINRPFIQPAIGFRHKYFEMAVGARLVKLYYTNIHPSSSFLADNEVMQKFNELNNKALLEPFATLKIGSETTKLQFQIVKTQQNNENSLAIDGPMISVGLHFQFN